MVSGWISWADTPIAMSSTLGVLGFALALWNFVTNRQSQSEAQITAQLVASDNPDVILLRLVNLGPSDAREVQVSELRGSDERHLTQPLSMWLPLRGIPLVAHQTYDVRISNSTDQAKIPVEVKVTWLTKSLKRYEKTMALSAPAS